MSRPTGGERTPYDGIMPILTGYEVINHRTLRQYRCPVTDLPCENLDCKGSVCAGPDNPRHTFNEAIVGAVALAAGGEE